MTMPASTNPRQTTAVLNSIYDDYASVFTVPLTFDLGDFDEKKPRAVSLDKELPPPPPMPTQPLRISKTPPITVKGRSGFGSSLRSRSPLSREWSEESESEVSSYGALVRRSAMKRRTQRDSTDSVESIWFAPDGYNLSPPRSRSKTPDYRSDSSDSSVNSHDTFERAAGSIDTMATQHSRIRVFQTYVSSQKEIHVGPLYEVLSYIWDTMSQPCNVQVFKSAFGQFALPRSSVLNLVASNFISLENFLKSAELQVYINADEAPRNISLDTIEITLDQELVDTFGKAHGSALQAAKGMLRISLIQKVGEYIVNHILLYDGLDELISPSIDLARSKEGKGAEITAKAIFGGISSFGWYSGRLRVFFRKDNNVYRIPHQVLGDLYRNIKVCAFKVEELDL
jgi:hypothetical protein